MPTRICAREIARRLHIVALAVACLAGGSGLHPTVSAAQQQVLPDPRTEAIRLRNAGDLSGAIALLRSHLEAHPDDGDAVRLLAQTLYWKKDFAGARTVSERGLVAHPEDTELRILYARMLIERGLGTRAREVLAAVGSPSTGGRAEAILGTLAYWEGDLAAAEKLAASAITSGDNDPEIKRVRADVAVLTAPWIGVMPGFQHDDQPIDRLSLAAEGGWFPFASTSISVHAQGLRFRLADSVTRSASLADITLSHYAAAAHTELELVAGSVTRSFGSSSDLTGSASIALRLPDHVKAGVGANRSPYLATEASLSESIMTNTAIAYVHLDHPLGWLGEVAYQYQRYPDSNALTTAYLWLLARLVHSPGLTLRAGYSGSLQNSSENRFGLAQPTQPYPLGDARFDLAGAYRPYYTPTDLQSHSAIASLEAHLNPVASFSANGSYAFHAIESHPVLFVATTISPVTTTLQKAFYSRTFNPWNAHASFQLKPSADVSFVADGYLLRTGFYSTAGASLSLVYRFAERAIRQAGGY